LSGEGRSECLHAVVAKNTALRFGAQQQADLPLKEHIEKQQLFLPRKTVRVLLGDEIMTGQDYTWKKAFYEEEFNPAIPLIKKACQWIIMHYPDFSFTTGFKRVAINLVMIFAIAAVMGHLMLTSTGFLDFLAKMLLASCIASLLFLKTVAASVLWGIEQYQAMLRLSEGNI